MRANHAVTLGLCVGVAGLALVAMSAAGCGTDTFGTCADNNTCGGGGSDASVDGETETSTVVDSSTTMDTGSPQGDSAAPDSSVAADTGTTVTDSSTMDAPVETGPTCEAGTVACNGTCVNEQTDPNNCGMCGKTCAGPDAGMGMAQCTSGTCSVVCNGSTTLDCSGTCFDPHDVDHCGACSTVCMPPSGGNGTATCTGSTPTCGVSCNSGYHLCSGVCDPNSDVPSVTTDPCVLSEQFGVFVATPASGGSDATGAGTRAKPFATITHALGNLMGLQRVYVCNGTYGEQVSVTAPVGIYGGMTCAGGNWQYATGTTANVASPSASFALKVSGVSGLVQVEDMTFTSPAASGTDTSGNGNSSLAALVNASTVSFVRTTLTAGAGAPGNPGANGTTAPNYTGATAQDGAAAGGGNPSAAGGAAVCQNKTTSTGGGGGVAGTSTVSGGPGGTGQWNPAGTTSMGFDGVGGPGGGATCTPGDSGANGASQSGGSSASQIGGLAASGWTPSSGTSGLDGDPGQGGGGGGGKGTPAIGGDGAGAGGCGGTGGRGGGGGGASIALASFNATVTLTFSVLGSAAGGNGGAGGSGEPGQGGGGSSLAANACPGGLGGNGAGGSGGAGGTGGSSVGILWKGGTQPSADSFTTSHTTVGSAGTVGTSGGAGSGGSNALGTGNSGNAGAAGTPGTSAAVLQSP